MEEKTITCIGGLEAIEYFESLPIPKGQEELRDRALNRIKYEVAKGIGKPKRTIKAVKPWHSDTYACGKCGYGISEAHFGYCPNCGTAILKNPHTQERVKKYEEIHQISLDEWLKGNL